MCVYMLMRMYFVMFWTGFDFSESTRLHSIPCMQCKTQCAHWQQIFGETFRSTQKPLHDFIPGVWLRNREYTELLIDKPFPTSICDKTHHCNLICVRMSIWHHIHMNVHHEWIQTITNINYVLVLGSFSVPALKHFYTRHGILSKLHHSRYLHSI